MCSVSSTSQIQNCSKGRHLKIWQLAHHTHCLIIGTCLELRDLRKIGRKLGLKFKPDFPIDYQLHAYFVNEAEHSTPAAKLLNQLLDHRFSRYIQRISKLENTDLLLAEWELALAEGNMPGPFWALMSYSKTPPDLQERAYADVHMLSHIKGATRRENIRQNKKNERELEDVKLKLKSTRKHHFERMNEKSREIEVLHHSKHTKVEQKDSHVTNFCISENKELKGEILRFKNRLKTEITSKNKERTNLNQTIKLLQSSIRSLEEENATLKKEIKSCELLPDHKIIEKNKKVDLNNRCILYVGGQSKCVSRYQEIVASLNGKLLHHDGGKEKSLHELEQAISQADTVVFPCDCVSHSAVQKVKKLCRKKCKRYDPLRSSGLSSLLTALTLDTDTNVANDL